MKGSGRLAWVFIEREADIVGAQSELTGLGCAGRC